MIAYYLSLKCRNDSLTWSIFPHYLCFAHTNKWACISNIVFKKFYSNKDCDPINTYHPALNYINNCFYNQLLHIHITHITTITNKQNILEVGRFRVIFIGHKYKTLKRFLNMIFDILELKPFNSHIVHFRIITTIKPIQNQSNPIMTVITSGSFSFVYLCCLILKTWYNDL